MLLDFSKQCTDVMLEGLSNNTTQTCYPLCGHKKLNKLDDGKKFSIFKKGIGIESKKNCGNKIEIKEKVGECKQVREWKQIKDEAQGLLNVERKLILRYLLSLF